jgi:hypothetical protein
VLLLLLLPLLLLLLLQLPLIGIPPVRYLRFEKLFNLVHQRGL